MGRNLVVCCDGTSNEFAQDRTNVAKLCLAMVKDQERQLVHYHPGVGTMAPPGFVTGFGDKLAKLAGLAFGYGIKNDIRDAYVYIMNHYRPGDRLFLFGFSRGAYTARAVAGMIRMYGLVMPGNEALIPYAVKMFWAINGEDDEEKRKDHFRLAAEFRDSLAGVTCKPHFVGVWDTVSSVGWIGKQVALPYTKNNPDIHIARHAVSIDEYRAFFRTNLMTEDAGSDVKQVWFPGVHCDVGGGYAEKESGLSKIALKWMAEEAIAAGLLIDQVHYAMILGGDEDHAPPNPKAKLHESLKGFWRLAEYVPKRYWNYDLKRYGWRRGNFHRRSMGERPLVHPCAWEVGDGYEKRLPAGARRWEPDQV